MKEIIKSIWAKQKKDIEDSSTILAVAVCFEVYFSSFSDAGFRSAIEHQVKFLLVIVIGRLFVNVIGWSKEKTEKVSQLGPNLAPRSSIQLGSETTKVLKEIEDKKDERTENGGS